MKASSTATSDDPIPRPNGARRPLQAHRHPLVISLGVLVLSLVLRWSLDPLLGDRQPLSLVYGAVAIAVWAGGWRHAIIIVVAGYLASDWLFIPPKEEFGLNSVPDLIAVAVFVASCGIIIAFGEAMHRARSGLLASTRKLEELNMELKEADTQKDDFVATLAHELRNVLAPMRNALQVVKLRGSGDPQLVTAADLADRQVARMARLLEDLLETTRIRKGKIDIRREPVSLAAVIEAAVEISRPNIEGARHTLTVTLPEQPLQLDADPARLTQVFSNLLNNSAKYTDPGGTIELNAAARDGAVHVRVKDNGIGFAPEWAGTLFAPYRQAEAATRRAQGGLGIGLALVKAIVELHGGRVQARSPGVNHGSEFIVVLPLASG